MLTKETDLAIGVACMKKRQKDICKIKRIYIRPDYRRKKVGQKLLD